MLKLQGTTYTAAHIEVRYDATFPHVAVATFDPAVGWVDRGLISVQFLPGDQFGARALSDGTVDVFRNGVKAGTASIAGWAYAATGGYLGLTLDGAFQSQLDDFGGGTWVPVSASPVVVVTSPDGGESWVGGSQHVVPWAATDDIGVTSVDVFYRDHATSPWIAISQSIANSGTFDWFVHNTPTADARVKVLAFDADGHAGADSSHADFTITATPGGVVATTLRDFQMPGTQPFGAGGFSSSSPATPATAATIPRSSRAATSTAR